MSELETFKEHLREAHALHKAADLLEWDQQVNMPRQGVTARMEQTALLKRLVHERLADPRLGERARTLLAGLPAGSDEAALARWTLREQERRSKVPARLVAELARQTSLAQDVWVEARAKSDFGLFAPALERVVELKREQARALGPADRLYDAWLSEFEPGMTTPQIAALLEGLKPELIALTRAVAAQPSAVDDAPLRGRFPLDAQRSVCEQAAQAIGFDFSAGRLDVSAHPFCTSFSRGDVRLTTRFSEASFVGALFGVLHEAGHGLYEQNVAAALEGLPLCAGSTMGLHESQSRLWENIVGRSRGFCAFFLPRLKAAFPQLSGLSAEGLYRAVNRATPSLIRVEADELTYGLHVILRFELEQDLLSGALRVADLPAAWAAKTRAYLGLTPPDDARGVLQDVHWSDGLFGYFPTYVLGNVISAQLFAAAVAARPGIPRSMAAGDFSALRGWLAENVHRHGRKLFAGELVLQATGKEISPEPYLSYLRAKFGELYSL